MRNRWKKTLGAFIAVAGVASAIGAGASAALPEWVNTDGTHFAEFQTEIPNTVTLLIGKPALKVICQKGFGWLKISGSSVTGATVFQRCRINGNEGYTCSNTELEKEKILATVTLSGKLGYINKATKEVGLELYGEPFAYGINCKLFTSTKTEMLGRLFGKVTPVNNVGYGFSIEYSPISAGSNLQSITGFEGGPSGQLSWNWKQEASAPELTSVSMFVEAHKEGLTQGEIKG
jgi:hypothetical protein